jgi:hypothetical protein
MTGSGAPPSWSIPSSVVLTDPLSAPQYPEYVSGDQVRTAAELEALSPDERDAAVRAGFVTDPAAVTPDLLARARRKADARIAATEGADATR